LISQKASVGVLLFLTLAVALVFSLLPRIPQPPAYHMFADQRGFLGIPNFLNVFSNLPFAIIGLWGLVFLFQTDSNPLAEQSLDRRDSWPYLFVFVGLLLTAFGSSYYHLEPNNARLVWDRLPMTIAFMSMVAAVITETISRRMGLSLLPVLLLVGLGSVLQWYKSEARGAGDLRFYAAVQVYSALVLLVAPCFSSRYTRRADLALVLGFYVIAKALETLDKPIFAMGHVVSGHTLKHLAAAGAGYYILRMVRKRRPVNSQSSLSHPERV